MKVNLSNTLYDIIKFLALYLLPGLAGLYFGLAGIWGLPHPEEVVGTIMAVATFFGVVLGLSASTYNNKIKTDEKFARQVPMPFMRPTISNYFPAMSNKAYDVLYWIAQIVLPALGTLYFALATIWQLPYGQQVVGTIALIDAFLGIFLGINTAQYKKNIY